VEHEELVREYYDTVDDGRIDDLLALFAADATYERPGHDTIDGKAALERFYREERTLDGEHVLHAVLVDGDTVSVRGQFTGTDAGDPITVGFADFHRVDAGEITERHTYTDTTKTV
jgi:ketosteroid isomerase-like protein